MAKKHRIHVDWEKTRDVFGFDFDSPRLSKRKVIYRCPSCQKTSEVRFDTISKRKYAECHSCILESPEYKANKSSVSKKLWQDPQFVQKQSQKKSTFIKSEFHRNIDWEQTESQFGYSGIHKGISRKPVIYRCPKCLQTNQIRYDNVKRRKHAECLQCLTRKPKYKQKIVESVRNQKKISSIETTLAEILDDLSIDYYQQYKLGFCLFDFFLPDHKILIECNGDYWHSLPRAEANKSKSSYIDNFPDYQLKTIWEHEFKCLDRISNLIQYWCNSQLRKIDFSFSDLTVRDINPQEARKLLNKYHYSHGLGNHQFRTGAFHEEECIAVCVFGNLTRKETANRLGLKPNQMMELTRFCIHPSYQKRNLASWLISRSIKRLKKTKTLKCLVSFADSTFNHDGTIYKASNWALDGEVAPSYWYVDPDGYVMHKKTLWNHAKSLGMKEQEFAQEKGYQKIKGKKKFRYLYRL